MSQRIDEEDDGVPATAGEGAPETETEVALQQAIHYGIRLKEDLELIKAKYLQAKGENSTLKKQLNAALLNAEDAMKEKEAVVANTERMYREWNDMLVQAKDKCAELQAQVIPNREMELLRLQLLEELEGPHRQRMETLTLEVKKHREAYFDAHRAAELLKTELSQREEVWQATMKDLKSAHARELDDLSAQLKHYHNLADSVASSTATRDLERKVSELTLRQNQLLAECQDLRRENYSLKISEDTLKVTHAQRTRDMQGRLETQDRVREGLENKCSVLMDELHAERASRAAAEERFVVLEQQQRAADDRAAQEARTLRVSQQQVEAQLAELKDAMAARAASHAEALAEHAAELAKVLAEKNAALDKISFVEREAKSALRTEQDANAIARAEMKRQVAEAQARAAEYHQEAVTVETALRAEISSLKEQLAAAAASEQAAVSERTKLLSGGFAINQTAAAQKREEDLMKKASMLIEVNKERDSLQDALQELKRDHSTLSAELARVKAEASSRAASDKEALEEADAIIHELRDQVELVKSKWAQEHEHTKAQLGILQAEYEARLSHASGEMARLLQGKEKYKQLVFVLKERLAVAAAAASSSLDRRRRQGQSNPAATADTTNVAGVERTPLRRFNTSTRTGADRHNADYADDEGIGGGADMTSASLSTSVLGSRPTGTSSSAAAAAGTRVGDDYVNSSRNDGSSLRYLS